MFVEGSYKGFGVVRRMHFAKLALQGAARELAQLAFGVKNKRLPTPVATALHGR